MKGKRRIHREGKRGAPLDLKLFTAGRGRGGGEFVASEKATKEKRHTAATRARGRGGR